MLAGCAVHSVAQTVPTMYRHVVVGGAIDLELKWQKSFRYEIWCLVPCEADPAVGIADGAKHVAIRPLSVGPMDVSVTLTRIDNGQMQRDTLPPFEVVLPDHFKLACYDVRDRDFHECDALELRA